jgi:hypothetical protein
LIISFFFLFFYVRFFSLLVILRIIIRLRVLLVSVCVNLFVLVIDGVQLMNALPGCVSQPAKYKSETDGDEGGKEYGQKEEREEGSCW